MQVHDLHRSIFVPTGISESQFSGKERENESFAWTNLFSWNALNMSVDTEFISSMETASG